MDVENVDAQKVVAYNLRIFRKELDLTQGEFADAIHVKRSTYATYEKNIMAPAEVLSKINERFNAHTEKFYKPIPEGVGKFSTVQESEVKYDQAVPINMDDYHIMWVPIVPEHAHAGYLRGYKDPEWMGTLPKHPFITDKQHKGNYMAFIVSGDSMEDGTDQSILEGDKLLCREVRIDLWKSKLHMHKWTFVIVHKTEGILIKNIVAHDVKNHTITIHSLNPIFEDMVVDLEDIAQLYNVVKLERKR